MSARVSNIAIRYAADDICEILQASGVGSRPGLSAGASPEKPALLASLMPPDEKGGEPEGYDLRKLQRYISVFPNGTAFGVEPTIRTMGERNLPTYNSVGQRVNGAYITSGSTPLYHCLSVQVRCRGLYPRIAMDLAGQVYMVLNGVSNYTISEFLLPNDDPDIPDEDFIERTYAWIEAEHFPIQVPNDKLDHGVAICNYKAILHGLT